MAAELERIKDQIRKLMAVANDGAASDGEITNYMNAAAKLIDKHHLKAEDFEKKDEAPDADESKMELHLGKTGSPKFHRWNTILANAVEQLFGCVKHYLDGDSEPMRIDGVVQFYTGKYAGQRKEIKRFAFYGPAQEAAEAAELYTMWDRAIATMAVMRWGGAYRGSGEKYAEGFAAALLVKAMQINKARQLVEAKPLALLTHEVAAGKDTALAIAESKTTSITLSERYEKLQERAAEWLENDQGIKLGKGAARQGAQSGDNTAFREGHEHGSKAEFTRTGRAGQQKQLPGPKQ